MSVIDRVRDCIRQHDLIRPESRVLAAVSGGSDSVALVHVLQALDASGDLKLVGLVHFDHQLRAAATGDKQFVIDLAARMNQPVFVGAGDVAARARRERRSLEDAARAARYEYFERAREEANAELVALGHTRDDQAETFLLRLLRGAGPRGLASMHPCNGRYVRPVLDCRREALRAWLQEQGVRFIEDDSNQDVAIPRNRVRRELLPLLEERFNPGIVDVLAREAALARDAWEWQESVAAELAARLVRSIPPQGAPDTTEIDISELAQVPLAVRRSLLWRVIGERGAAGSITFDHVEAALRLTDQPRDVSIDVPGLRVQRIGGRLVLIGRRSGVPHEGGQSAPNIFRYPLSIPGEVALPESGGLLSAEPFASGGDRTNRAHVRSAADESIALVRGDLVSGSLAVRNRRPGDRFRPVGLKGRKKLQDYFVDLKIARSRRDTVPIVVDETDRIVWVAGYGIDEAFRVTDPAQAVLILKLRQVDRLDPLRSSS